MRDIESLLKVWVDATPKRQAKVSQILRDAGLDETTIQRELKIKVAKPGLGVKAVPTFESTVWRNLSPMLATRFRFAGTIKDGPEKWLNVQEMEKAMRDPKILRVFRSLAEHWENSAPALYNRERITLFSYEIGAEENQTYLIWPESENLEPKIYRYSGQSEHIFDNFAEFLRWSINSDDYSSGSVTTQPPVPSDTL